MLSILGAKMLFSIFLDTNVDVERPLHDTNSDHKAPRSPSGPVLEGHGVYQNPNSNWCGPFNAFSFLLVS